MPVVIAKAVRYNGLGFQGYNALGANRYLTMLAKLLGLPCFTLITALLVFRTAKKTIWCDRS
jgi:hypothetical protein